MRRLVLLAVTTAACTSAPLQPVQQEGPAALDDKLTVRGSVCTKPPADERFPVKIMFVIDTSDSMHITDPASQRVNAVTQVIDRYAGNPAVKFSVIAFDAVVSDITKGFVSNPDTGAIGRRLGQSDRLTDYQGALGAAYATLAKDMMETAPAERARSKYVVIFFSDGVPDPQCFANAQQPFLHVCTVERDDWPDTFQLPGGTNPNTGAAWSWDDFQGLYPDLEAGKDYNTPDQLEGKVRDILELGKAYNVNEIRFHSGFLFDPNLNPAFITAFNLDRAKGESLLRGMAVAGNGSFTEFTSGASISFLNVNYTSVKQAYVLTNLYVDSRSSLPSPSGMVLDSDGDGLSDEVEDELRLCASEKGGASCNLGNGRFADPLDSDGDGYGDAFEYAHRASGFDPKRPSSATSPCRETGDTDGDGLRDCEERYLGTDLRLFDTDGDRFSDGVEVRFGMDPTKREDASRDDDADGTRNADELLAGWTPGAKEILGDNPAKQRFTITPEPESADGRSCYDFEITGIRLMTTRALGADKRGKNHIEVVFMEGPRDDPADFGTVRSACLTPRWVAPDLKQPANGVIELADDDFGDPTDPMRRCVDPTQPEMRTP